MESLLKQARSIFSRKDEFGSSRDGRLPPQRTPSFREKRPRKWFQRQFSRQMSSNQFGDEAEYAAAVAAAAFAITSLEPDDVDQGNIRGPQFSLPRIRSKLAETIAALTEPGAPNEYTEHNAHDAERFGNYDTANREAQEMVPEKTIHAVPSIRRPKKRLTFADEQQDEPPTYSTGRTPSFGEEQFKDEGRIKPPRRTPSLKHAPSFGEEQFENEGRIRPPRRTPTVKEPMTYGEQQFEDEERIKPPRRAPSVKMTPTFDEEGLEDTKRMKPEFDAPKPIFPSPITPPQIPPLTIQPAAPPRGAQRPRDHGTDADAWEMEEMAKIKRRYEKLNATILDWEDKKKKKAKRKLEMSESDVEKKRVKAMQKYQIDMEQIKQIADGARAQAKEKQRKEEFKVKDKANRYEELNATILVWENKKKNKAERKLETTESDLEKKRAKAFRQYQIEIEQIKQVANGARAKAQDKLRNEELKIKEKASRYRATGEQPPPPVCPCS